MLTKDAFDSLLDAVDTFILDGALATELEARGHDLNHPLWSAKILQDDPASIEEVHFDYFAAGAYIAITASYQAATDGLEQHLQLSDAEGRDLIKRSVEVAKRARDKAYTSVVGRNRPLLVAGSVGPYGAFLSDGSEYTGAYKRTAEQYMEFHRPRIAALIDAGVDMLAIETIPNIDEIRALLLLLEKEFPTAIAWIGCTIKDTSHLADGTPLSEVVTEVEQHQQQIISFGINCTPMALSTETLGNLRKVTQMPLVLYPNSGEAWDAVSKTWHGQRAEDFLNTEQRDVALAKLSAELDNWTANGARLIGGCCRTGPSYVRAVRNHFERR